MWLVTKSLDPFIKGMYTHIAPHTDHYAVEMRIQKFSLEQGPGRWIMSTKIIKSGLFKETFGTFWKTWKQKKVDYNTSKEWWEEGKHKIKDITIWCGKKIGNKERHIWKELEKSLKETQKNSPEKHAEINKIKQEMNEINAMRSDGARIRAKLQWIEDGEQGTSFFHGLEKSRGCSKQWTSIKTPDGNTKNNNNDILNTQREFYKKLYSKEHLDHKAIEELLEKIDAVLTEDEKEFCESEITKEEINRAVKELKTGSSPGMDGISYEFYKEYWHIIAEDMVEMIKEVTHSECTPSQYMGIIILLYKNGIREMIENWRPITLLNCDYKIIEKVIANRLKKVISKLIKQDQKAYVKGRYIGDNARLMSDIIFECDLNDYPGAIIFIDQKKAYDRVEWEWLQAVLKRFNFGPKFRNWISMLYMNARSTVLTNGHFSETFQLGRGLRQGSPLSSLLYVLQAEPFAEAIRKSDNLKGIKIENDEIKITAYADDTQIYIRDEKSKYEMDKILKLYSEASGAEINTQKTEGIILNNMNKIDGIKWTQGPVKALGVPQGLIENLSQFWDTVLQKVRKRLEMWKKRNLSIQGKVHVIKTLAISNVVYAAGLKTIPENKIKEFNSEIWKFLWNGKMEPVKREICMRKNDTGGIGMPNLIDIIKTRQIMMVKRILSEGNETWKILPRKYFQSLDKDFAEQYFLLKAVVPDEIIEELKIPLFYKQCIKSWQQAIRNQEYSSVKQEILAERLWYNHNIAINGQMLANKTWAKAGVHIIGDILDDNGLVLLDKIQDKIKGSDIILYTNKVIAALPKKWINTLRKKEEDCIKLTNQKSIPLHEKLSNITSKIMYETLQKEGDKTRWQISWEDKYGALQWDKINSSMKNKLSDRKCIDVHWKSLNFGLNTEEKLAKMKLSNGKCMSCTIEEETVEHLFHECELIERTWSVINEICHNIWDTNIDDIMSVIFTKFSKDKPHHVYEVMQYIILSVKWIIWKRRNIVKYDDRWISAKETEQWVTSYLRKRTELLIKMNIKENIKNELKRLLEQLQN